LVGGSIPSAGARFYKVIHRLTFGSPID